MVVCAIAIALWWPHTSVFWFDSHERFDYVSRTVEYRDALGRGELYPRWSPSFYGGYGSPFFNFYAPVVYWLGGALALATDSPTVALKLVVLLGSLCAGLGAFLLVQLETKRADAAFAAACLYLAAPYRLANVDWRGDLAEYFALGMLPIALWSYRRIARAERLQQLPGRALCAVLAHAVLICSHTLTGLWGTGFALVIVLLSVAQLIARRSPERASALGAAFACSLLASAVYTLPALGEKRFVRVETMTLNEVATINNFVAPGELWNAGPLRIAPLFGCAIAAIALAMLVARARKRPMPTGALAWLLGASALVWLTLPASEAIWSAKIIPFADYLQFPWRLLGPASLGAAIATGLAFAVIVPDRSFFSVCALAVLPMLWLARPQTVLTPIEGEKVMLSAQRIKNTWVRGTSFDEYLPRPVTDTSKRFSSKVARSNATLAVSALSSEGTEHQLSINAKDKGQLPLKLHAFPGWQVETIAGPARVMLETNGEGLVQLAVPKAGEYRVRVHFGATRLRELASVLSWLGVLAIWPAVALLARRRGNWSRARAAAPLHEGHAHA